MYSTCYRVVSVYYEAVATVPCTMPSMTVDCLASLVNTIGVQFELYSELCEE